MTQVTYSDKGGTRIKYDKKIFILLLAGLVVSGLFLTMGIVNFEQSAHMAFCSYSIFGGGAIFIICFIECIAVLMYFRRLKRYGYVIPDNAKKYDKILGNLQKTKETDEKSVYAKYSIIGAFLTCAICIGYIIWEISFYIRWHNIGENASVTLVLSIFPFVIVVIYAVVLFKQSNKDRYRDDVEIDAGRKVRESPGQILISLTVLSLILFFTAQTEESMTKYVFSIMVDADMMQAESIREAFIIELEDVGDKGVDYTTCESYQLLLEGEEITDWEEPMDEYAAGVAERLGIANFHELRDDFRVAQSDAKVYVKINNGKVGVRLLNPKAGIERINYFSEIYVEEEYYSMID